MSCLLLLEVCGSESAAGAAIGPASGGGYSFMVALMESLKVVEVMVRIVGGEPDGGRTKDLVRSKTSLQRQKKMRLTAGSYRSNKALAKDCEERGKKSKKTRGVEDMSTKNSSAVRLGERRQKKMKGLVSKESCFNRRSSSHSAGWVPHSN